MHRLTQRTTSRQLIVVAVIAALASGVTGCADGDEGAAGASATPSRAATPEALPTQDWNRLACEALPHGALELLDNLGDTRRAAENAAKSSDALVRQHGRALLDAVNARETADLNGDHNAAVDANLAISEASLDLAEACSALYGDGNW